VEIVLGQSDLAIGNLVLVVLTGTGDLRPQTTIMHAEFVLTLALLLVVEQVLLIINAGEVLAQEYVVNRLVAEMYVNIAV
jgi:hypothetical protein